MRDANDLLQTADFKRTGNGLQCSTVLESEDICTDIKQQGSRTILGVSCQSHTSITSLWCQAQTAEEKGLSLTVDEQGGVTTVIHEQVGAGAIGPREHLLRAPPVLLQSLALPGEHRRAVAGHSGRSVVLRTANCNVSVQITARAAGAQECKVVHDEQSAAARSCTHVYP